MHCLHTAITCNSGPEKLHAARLRAWSSKHFSQTDTSSPTGAFISSGGKLGEPVWGRLPFNKRAPTDGRRRHSHPKDLLPQRLSATPRGLTGALSLSTRMCKYIHMHVCIHAYMTVDQKPLLLWGSPPLLQAFVAAGCFKPFLADFSRL